MPEPPGGGSPLSRIPKPVLLGGGAVIVGVGYIFYRKRKSAAAAAAAANSDNTSTQMGAASGGAYGNPLPGSGMLAPILINVGGSGASTTDPGADPPKIPIGPSSGTTLPMQPGVPPPVPASGIPPPIAAFLQGKVMQAGENIVQEVADPLGGWLALTNKGGVYTYGGAPFMGSYLGYADQTKDPAAEKAGRGSFTQIVPRANGGYTLIDQHGETYNFDPGTPKSAGGTA